MNVLVTGATGYIGGRLAPRLLEQGHRVRLLVRDPARIVGREWAGNVEIAVGDLRQPDTLPRAFEGIDAAYYLVHSMYAGTDYARHDREAAHAFVRAAKSSPSLRHVIYLGGLLPEGGRISKHLLSRAQVGKILRDHLPVTEFRAGPIIGSGSASFEMVRYLTERLPVMITPIWVRNPVQPIGVRDVLRYLTAALDRDPMDTVDVGTDPQTFRRMLEVYAEVRGLRRAIFPVPIIAPRIAAIWIGRVTPIPNALAVPLVEGIVEPVLADTAKARALFPEIQPISYREAVRLAIERTEQNRVQTRWTGALGPRAAADSVHPVGDNPPTAGPGTFELTKRRGRTPPPAAATTIPSPAAHSARDLPHRARSPRDTRRVFDTEGLIREVRTIHVDAPPELVFHSFVTLGGSRGWLVWEWAWKIRGAMDTLVGGPGLRRGRRDPVDLLPGEVLDFWRVEAVQPPEFLRLRAEMKVPGKAWLQWEAVPERGGSLLVQTAMFLPYGFPGVAYWYSLYPIHRTIFSDMVRAIAHDARRFVHHPPEAAFPSAQTTLPVTRVPLP